MTNDNTTPILMESRKPQIDQQLDVIRDELFSMGIVTFPENHIKSAMREAHSDITFIGTRLAMEYGVPQQMMYSVLLKKDNQTNFYHTRAIEAQIENEPLRIRQFNLTNMHFRIDQIQNLLNGRSLRKPELNLRTGKVDNYWYLIDYSKKDDFGDSKLTEMSDLQVSLTKSSVTGKDVTQGPLLYDVIGKFPLKENLVPEQRLNVILNMLQGNAVPVKVFKDESGATSPGYMQFGDRPDQMELMMHKDGKLVKLGADLRELKAPVIPSASLRRKGRQL